MTAQVATFPPSPISGHPSLLADAQLGVTVPAPHRTTRPAAALQQSCSYTILITKY